MPSRLTLPVTGGSPNPLGSLTAAARPLPEDADWQAHGTQHDPEACLRAWVWQKCSDATVEAPKPLNDGVDAVEFQPFLIEANAKSCGGLVGDFDLLAARARRVLQWNASSRIAYALSSAAPDGLPNVNPNLPGVAEDITNLAGPQNLVNTIQGLLQDAVACGLNGDLFIHAPHWTLPQFLNDYLITQVGSTFKMGGHTVVLDQGYANEPPTDAPIAQPGEAWIYISGPVEYATGPVNDLQDRSPTRGLDIRLNDADAIAAQLAIYRFDPCCVKAARAAVC